MHSGEHTTALRDPDGFGGVAAPRSRCAHWFWAVPSGSQRRPSSMVLDWASFYVCLSHRRPPSGPTVWELCLLRPAVHPLSAVAGTALCCELRKSTLYDPGTLEKTLEWISGSFTLPRHLIWRTS